MRSARMARNERRGLTPADKQADEKAHAHGNQHGQMCIRDSFRVAVGELEVIDAGFQAQKGGADQVIPGPSSPKTFDFIESLFTAFPLF